MNKGKKEERRKKKEEQKRRRKEKKKKRKEEKKKRRKKKKGKRSKEAREGTGEGRIRGRKEDERENGDHVEHGQLGKQETRRNGEAHT